MSVTQRFHPRRMAKKISGRDASEQIGSLRQVVDGVAERSQVSARAAEFHTREVNRISPQLAALESKVEQLRLALATPSAGPDDLTEARSLVETIQDEHRRIRVRLTALTQYEERLRRIEDQLGFPHD